MRLIHPYHRRESIATLVCMFLFCVVMPLWACFAPALGAWAIVSFIAFLLAFWASFGIAIDLF